MPCMFYLISDMVVHKTRNPNLCVRAVPSRRHAQQIYEAQCALEQPITQVESAIHIQQEATNSAQFLDAIHP